MKNQNFNVFFNEINHNYYFLFFSIKLYNKIVILKIISMKLLINVFCKII